MKKLTLLALFLSITLSFGQTKFDGNSAYEWNKILSADMYEGRQTGLKGGYESSQWIAKKFEQFGLEPGGKDDTYFQYFPLLVTKETAPVKMELTDPRKGKIKYYYQTDFTAFTNSGSGEFELELAFIGLGISEPEKEWDDIANINLKNKALIMYRTSPKKEGDWQEVVSRDYKMKLAKKMGAKAVLIYQREIPIRGGAVHKEAYQPDIPGFYISKKVLRDFLEGTKKNVDDLLDDCRENPISFNIENKKIYIKAEIKKQDTNKGRNVVGIFRGSDPNLKDEYIVVGGHIDHIGTSGNGIIYNGADDNASGTSVVMELGRTFTKNRIPTKRSIIFVGFGAEEQGLIGSTYFVNHPIVPKENIVAMLNFDMVGSGNGGVGVGAIEQFPEIWENIEKSLSEKDKKKIKTFMVSGEGRGGSDNYPFIKNHIPAFSFFSMGRHPFYHRPEDDIELINKDALQFVGQTAFNILYALSNSGKKLNDGLRDYRFLYNTRIQVDFNPEELEIEEPVFYTYWRKGINGKLIPLPSEDIDEVLKKSALYIDKIQEKVKLCNKIDILDNKNKLSSIARRHNLGMILTATDTHIFENNPDMIDIYTKLGLKAVLLNVKDQNIFDADGITPFGKELIEKANSNNIIILFKYEPGFYSYFKDLENIPFILISENELNELDTDLFEIIKSKNSKLIITLTGENSKNMYKILNSKYKDIIRLDYTNLDKEDIFEIMKKIHQMGINFNDLRKASDMDIF